MNMSMNMLVQDIMDHFGVLHSLTGSRRFYTSTEDSDWDHFICCSSLSAEREVNFKTILRALGFEMTRYGDMWPIWRYKHPDDPGQSVDLIEINTIDRFKLYVDGTQCVLKMYVQDAHFYDLLILLQRGKELIFWDYVLNLGQSHLDQQCLEASEAAVSDLEAKLRAML